MADFPDSTPTRKISGKKRTQKRSDHSVLTDAIDELYASKNMFECAYLAIAGAGIGHDTVWALHAVMVSADEKLDAGIAIVQALLDEAKS